MIFVTVGSQLPFDRMIEAIDEVAPLLQGKEIIAQVEGSNYTPKHFKTLAYIAPADYKSYINNAELVISHAGTGTILSVSQMKKPLIVFPRLGNLRETRNNHQMATCKMLESLCNLQVAYNKDELREKIQSYLKGELPIMEEISPYASDQMLNSIKSFIETEKKFVITPAPTL